MTSLVHVSTTVTIAGRGVSQVVSGAGQEDPQEDPRLKYAKACSSTDAYQRANLTEATIHAWQGGIPGNACSSTCRCPGGNSCQVAITFPPWQGVSPQACTTHHSWQGVSPQACSTLPPWQGVSSQARITIPGWGGIPGKACSSPCGGNLCQAWQGASPEKASTRPYSSSQHVVVSPSTHLRHRKTPWNLPPA